MTQNKLRLNSPEVIQVIQRWWQSMMLPDDELAKRHIIKAASGTRARLQRCQTLNDIFIHPDFQSLWQQLPDEYRQQANTQEMTACALVAGALVFVRADLEGAISLATQAGTKDKLKGDKPAVSDQRFARLQAARTPDDLLRSLRRTLKQVKLQASVTHLIKDIQQWMLEYSDPYPRKADARIRVQWSMDYFRAASAGKA